MDLVAGAFSQVVFQTSTQASEFPNLLAAARRIYSEFELGDPLEKITVFLFEVVSDNLGPDTAATYVIGLCGHLNAEDRSTVTTALVQP